MKWIDIEIMIEIIYKDVLKWMKVIFYRKLRYKQFADIWSVLLFAL